MPSVSKHLSSTLSHRRRRRPKRFFISLRLGFIFLEPFPAEAPRFMVVLFRLVLASHDEKQKDSFFRPLITFFSLSSIDWNERTVGIVPLVVKSKCLKYRHLFPCGSMRRGKKVVAPSSVVGFPSTFGRLPFPFWIELLRMFMSCCWLTRSKFVCCFVLLHNR